MRHKQKRQGGRDLGVQNSHQTVTGWKFAELGTSCYCGYLRAKGVRAICSTCLNFDRIAREVELRHIAGYMGFAL